MRTASEFESIDDFVKGVMQDKDGNPDLRLSVYDVSGDICKLKVQIPTEHYASIENSPRSQVVMFLVPSKFLQDIAVVESTPGGTRFRTSNDAHRELVTSHGPRFRTLSEFLFKKAGKPEAQVELTRADQISYIKTRLDENCSEWIQLVGDSAKNGWAKIVNRKPKPIGAAGTVVKD